MKAFKGTAYYRIDTHFMEFLIKCSEKYNIIGFEWDKDDPRNFGVVLEKRGGE